MKFKVGDKVITVWDKQHGVVESYNPNHRTYKVRFAGDRRGYYMAHEIIGGEEMDISIIFIGSPESLKTQYEAIKRYCSEPERADYILLAALGSFAENIATRAGKTAWFHILSDCKWYGDNELCHYPDAPITPFACIGFGECCVFETKE